MVMRIVIYRNPQNFNLGADMKAFFNDFSVDCLSIQVGMILRYGVENRIILLRAAVLIV